jgi:hypothetical protein
MVLVLDSGECRNRWTDASHAYFSCDPANPGELLAPARADLGAYPTTEVRHDAPDELLKSRALQAVPRRTDRALGPGNRRRPDLGRAYLGTRQFSSTGG